MASSSTTAVTVATVASCYTDSAASDATSGAAAASTDAGEEPITIGYETITGDVNVG